MKGHTITTKGIVTIVSSLLYLVGFGLFVGNLGQSLFSSSSNGKDILFPLMLSATACFILGWFNSKSTILAFLGTIITLIVGGPLSYLLLSPIVEATIKIIMPNSNITSSGSFSSIWLILTPIIVIEIVTDNVIEQRRWGQLATGIIVSLCLVWVVEIFTSNLGQNSRLDIIRLVIYAPVTWFLIVLFVNYKREMKYEY